MSTPFPRSRDDYNLFLQCVPLVILQACLLIFDMRKMKYEVVEGLVALIDAKKNYVRYIRYGEDATHIHPFPHPHPHPL